MEAVMALLDNTDPAALDGVIDDPHLIRPFLQAQVQVQRHMEETLFRTFLLSDQYRRSVL